MTDEKWGDIIFLVEQQFGFEERKKEPIIEQDEADNPVARGEKEILVFRTPEGRMRLERLSRPLVVDKKFHYFKSSAGQAQVEYIYSDTEKTHTIQAYRDVAGQWEPIDTSLPFSS